MIKNSLKNFFKNIIYLLIPMGIIYLVLLLVTFGFISSTLSNAKEMLTNLGELINNSVASSEQSVKEFFTYSINQIEWNGNFFDTVKSIINTHWLQNTVKGFLETLNATTEGFSDECNAIVSRFTGRLKADFVFAAVCLILGVIAANYAVRFVLRRKTAKRSFKKAVLATCLLPVAHAVFVILAFVVISYLKYYSLILVFIIAAVSGLVSLTVSWLVHGDKKIKLNEVANAKNVLQHTASSAIILLINVVLAIILLQVNKILAVLIVLPTLIYSLNIIVLNTDSYVISLAAQKPQPEEEIKEAA
ncbi:MAG: hypothetical protein K2G38_04705 [Clostridia bacterium]|nr:hypothetical protein [Clostridia bacterium]